MTSKLLTTREAAEYLNIPQKTLEQWRSRRQGPPYLKVGPLHVRYDRSQLERWLERNCTRNPQRMLAMRHARGRQKVT